MAEAQTPTANTAEPESDIHVECNQRIAEHETKWKRAVADAANREKELAREREEFTRFCMAGCIRDALPIGDALIAAGEGHAELQRLFTDFLKRHGVEAVGAVGERVDYLLHEIVDTRAESEKVPGTILEVAQVGYAMHGRLLRPAKVIISTELV